MEATITMVDGERARMIGQNQPNVRTLVIECSIDGCNGAGHLQKIFFSEREYLQAIETLPEEDRLYAVLYYHLASDLDRELSFLDSCQKCGVNLEAILQIVFH